ILLTVPEGYENLGRKIVQYFDFNKVEGLVRGGFRRQDSVFNALKQLPDTAEIVIIHDAARPFISPLIIDKSVQLCYTNRAVVVGIPCNDTIKIVEQGFIVETPQRDRMYKAQTPQVFEYKVLCEAYQKYNNLYNFTDDSQMVEMMGIKPYLMMGSPDNLKITTRDDLRLAEYLLAKH
ncbi:2-C-methyl-D-erythritol 4-phosphate cytidylyltransferase, partial [bacterium]|nr:2-C-methyl-D-erythritol 4-phosphate cytidylyltransferase [bacterium]